MRARNSLAFTRRKFLLDCSVLMAAALAVPTGVVAETTAPFSKKRSLRQISYSALAGQLNAPFRIQDASGKTIKVLLAEVKTHEHKPRNAGERLPPDAANESFSLFFSGSRSEFLAQNTYLFENHALGQFDLFIVPISTMNPARIDYEAVINRPRNQSFNQQLTKG
jgi:hypothetical protein